MYRAIPGLPVIPSSAEAGGAPDRQPSPPTQPPADVDAHAGTRSVPQSGLAYQPGLDGLRALSIIAVLLYHAGVSWAGGGFLGVESFFVLSGFLITSLLIAEWRESSRIRLGAFWARRSRRLLPALFALVCVIGIYYTIAGPIRHWR